MRMHWLKTRHLASLRRGRTQTLPGHVHRDDLRPGSGSSPGPRFTPAFPLLHGLRLLPGLPLHPGVPASPRAPAPPRAPASPQARASPRAPLTPGPASHGLALRMSFSKSPVREICHLSEPPIMNGCDSVAEAARPPCNGPGQIICCSCRQTSPSVAADHGHPPSGETASTATGNRKYRNDEQATAS